jgi:hypothetical protein
MQAAPSATIPEAQYSGSSDGDGATAHTTPSHTSPVEHGEVGPEEVDVVVGTAVTDTQVYPLKVNPSSQKSG